MIKDEKFPLLTYIFRFMQAQTQHLQPIQCDLEVAEHLWSQLVTKDNQFECVPLETYFHVDDNLLTCSTLTDEDILNECMLTQSIYQ